MAIVCSICGKKQSGFIMDYPLCHELNRTRICAACNEKKENMLKNANRDGDLYVQERNYFTNIISEQKLPDEVKKHMDEFIELCNQQYENYRQNEKEKFDHIEQEKERERILNDRIDNFLMTSGG